MPAQVVTATARLADGTPATIAPGREFDAIVTVQIQDGWHIYANPAGLAEMKPTTLGLDPQSERAVRLVKVSYPAGEAKVLGSLGTEKVALYEGKVEFTARLRLADDAKRRLGQGIVNTELPGLQRPALPGTGQAGDPPGRDDRTLRNPSIRRKP